MTHYVIERMMYAHRTCGKIDHAYFAGYRVRRFDQPGVWLIHGTAAFGKPDLITASDRLIDIAEYSRRVRSGCTVTLEMSV